MTPRTSHTRPDPARRSIRRSVRTVLLTGLAGGTLLLAGCGSDSPSGGTAGTSASPPRSSSPSGPVSPTRSDTASGALRALRVAGAYIPQQASPDVAVAYLTVTNTGDAGDVLVSVTTPAAPMVMLHETVGSGDTERMVPLGRVAVPAHTTVEFRVGHRHLMLMHPRSMLRQGQSVPMTLHFGTAGALTLTVPVVGFTGPQDGVRNGTPIPASPVPTDTPESPMPGMPDMGGTSSMQSHS